MKVRRKLWIDLVNRYRSRSWALTQRNRRLIGGLTFVTRDDFRGRKIIGPTRFRLPSLFSRFSITNSYFHLSPIRVSAIGCNTVTTSFHSKVKGRCFCCLTVPCRTVRLAVHYLFVDANTYSVGPNYTVITRPMRHRSVRKSDVTSDLTLMAPRRTPRVSRDNTLSNRSTISRHRK